ncbi:MAG: Plasmid pRiA4b ORF-3-like protein [Neobacillus sp.]|nr:Plasmid pRiA4b ORF-3-like protein [Neobacillus sp.]
MKIKISELKRHLKEYDQTELIQLIVELSKINKDVQNYLSSKFLGDEAVE